MAHVVVVLSSLVAASVALLGCGGSSDGAAEVARQAELRSARQQGAQEARQSARIAALEHKLKHVQKAKSAAGRPGDPRQPAPTATPAASSGDGDALEGLWKGEAVIDYDSGKSDPFQQTIQIESLAYGEVSGYSEAVQGSTTCHGTITFEGESEGWYRFGGDEQNKAECIDSSEVELRPISSDAIEYRESTDVSLSTGTLRRVG